MEYEIKPKNKLTIGVHELWQFRELFYFFTWRDIKVKYKQTVLGFLWAVLQPLVMTLLLTVSLGKVISTHSEMTLPYPVFALSGLIIWNVFSSGLSSAGNSMVNNSNIVKKIYFPRLIIPISAVLVSLFDFFMTLIIFVALRIIYKQPIDISDSLLFMPLGLILTCFSTFGLGALLAALNIKYRDFRYVIPFFIQGLLFMTPVIYPITLINNMYVKYFLAVNPMYAAVEFFRYGISPHELQTELIFVSIASTLIFFFVGLLYFRKTEAYFADLA